MAPHDLVDEMEKRIYIRRTQTAIAASTSIAKTPVMYLVTPIAPQWLYIKPPIQAYTCASSQCTPTGRFGLRQIIQADGIVMGEAIDGNDLWYRIAVAGKAAYINTAWVEENNLLTPQNALTFTPP